MRVLLGCSVRAVDAVAVAPRALLLESIRRWWRTASPEQVPAQAAQIRTWQDTLWKVNPGGLTGLIRPWREPVSPENGFEELKLTADDQVGSDQSAAVPGTVHSSMQWPSGSVTYIW